ncbi:nuclear transport factor 2 family protein [Algoriphagus aestuariicola]|uniref:nuclear transport factor 2 family protein n=1 Tax=Algoriphagus aestuariicola TaxID=1852016 RepID=UPI001F4955B4|nr:nuclear transport factor 2 family protein [Algoriphagus aestuariicola]
MNSLEIGSKNLSVIDGLYNAFALGDIPTVLGSMDPNIVWNEAEGNPYADGNPYLGPEAVLNGVFARIGAEHEYFNLKDIELHEILHGKVLATLRYDALRKNGKSYNVQVAHFWTLKDGKVVAFQQYADTKKLHEATVQ